MKIKGNTYGASIEKALQRISQLEAERAGIPFDPEPLVSEEKARTPIVTLPTTLLTQFVRIGCAWGPYLEREDRETAEIVMGAVIEILLSLSPSDEDRDKVIMIALESPFGIEGTW